MSPSVLHWVLRFIFIRVITVRVIQGMTSYYNQYILQVGLWTLMVVCVIRLWLQIHFLEESKRIVIQNHLDSADKVCIYSPLCKCFAQPQCWWDRTEAHYSSAGC